jgi:hypothetical protein
MTDLMKPTVHLNGTSKERLLEDYCDAIDALHNAGKALAKTCPNGRDYYPQGNGAINTAMNEHEERMRKLRVVIRELETIAHDLM